MARILSRPGDAAQAARPELERLLDRETCGARLFAAATLVRLDRSHVGARDALVRGLIEDGGYRGRAVRRTISHRLALVELLPRLRETALQPGLSDDARERVLTTIASLERNCEKDGGK